MFDDKRYNVVTNKSTKEGNMTYVELVELRRNKDITDEQIKQGWKSLLESVKHAKSQYEQQELLEEGNNWINKFGNKLK